MEVQISAKDVAALRNETGAGMMDCKKALAEANGDMEVAKDILRKKGQKLADKRADRDAKEGVIIALTSKDATKGIVINLSCETDFVAKNDNYIAFAQEIAAKALAHFPASLDDLLNLEYAQGITISEKIAEQVGVIGEKLQLSRYERTESPMVYAYIHQGYRLGVLVALNKAGNFEAAAKDVAMQVASMSPIAVSQQSVPQSVIEKELEIAKELARNEGKPENMLDKIAQGRLSKFFKDSTLLAQDFVKGDGTVADYLKSLDKDLTVSDFKRIALG
jgi:elongation factor Ts